MIAALEGGEWSVARPSHTLPAGKNRYPFYRRLGGPQGRSGWAENLVASRIWSWTVQPVVSRYTNWATHSGCMYFEILSLRKIQYVETAGKWNWVWCSTHCHMKIVLWIQILWDVVRCHLVSNCWHLLGPDCLYPRRLKMKALWFFETLAAV